MYLLPQHFRRDERNAIIGDVKPLLVFQQIKSYLQSGRDDAALVHNNPSQANMPADIYIWQYYRVFDAAVATYLYIGE